MGSPGFIMLCKGELQKEHFCLHKPYENLIFLQSNADLHFNRLLLRSSVLFILWCNDLLQSSCEGHFNEAHNETNN
jgi:hypothetical protein